MTWNGTNMYAQYDKNAHHFVVRLPNQSFASEPISSHSEERATCGVEDDERFIDK
jgi:hypothetical protein